MRTFKFGVHSVLVAFCLLLGCQGASGQQTVTPGKHPNSATKKKKQKKKKQNRGILGMVPSLGVVNAPDVPPMTPEEKLHLAVSEFANPFIVLEDAGKAQYYRATSPAAKIGYGGLGYAKQLGAAYLDTISGSMFSSFVYPTLLHQDPRYYRDGKGSIPSRAGYAIAHVFVSRSDAGQKEFNWSQVLGSTTQTLLSSTYYPARGRKVGRISSNIGWSILGDAGTNTFNEFWPDFSRWLSRKMGWIKK
jgi:hypothetical protein